MTNYYWHFINQDNPLPQYQVSSIKYPVSSIQYPVSSISIKPPLSHFHDQLFHNSAIFAAAYGPVAQLDRASAF